jgi:hypothetical protein
MTCGAPVTTRERLEIIDGSGGRQKTANRGLSPPEIYGRRCRMAGIGQNPLAVAPVFRGAGLGSRRLRNLGTIVRFWSLAVIRMVGVSCLLGEALPPPLAARGVPVRRL